MGDRSFFEQLHRVAASNGPDDEANDGQTITEVHNVCNICSSLFLSANDICFAKVGRGSPKKPLCVQTNNSAVTHSSWAQLQQSASEGCRICSLIEYEVARVSKPKEDDIVHVHRARRPSDESAMTWVIETFVPGAYETQARKGPTPQLKLTARSEGRSINNSITSDSTNSPDTLATIEKWIDECVSNHTTCRLSATEYRILPTRLLELTSAERSTRARLINGADLPPETEYVTLSHRWGAHENLQLENRTRKVLYEGIAACDLPLLFREACDFTLKLGKNYIWIDSLCIIQDSHDDWLSEGTKMADVYSNACLNIAANVASGSDGTLYSARNPLVFSPCSVKTRCACANDTIWHVSSSSGYWAPGSLDARGWVVQELLLPPRVLSFGKYKVDWTCNTVKCDELNPELNILPGMFDMDGGWRKSAHTKTDLHDSRTKNSGSMSFGEFTHSPLLNWQRIIQWKYTVARLSFEKDKLIAISGVAKKTSERSEGRLGKYVAGLWETDIASQLMWCSHAQACKRQREYQAPSWSWASLDGPVVWRDQNTSALKSEVISVRTTPVSEDPYSPVSHGSLIMAAKLCQIGLCSVKFKGFNPATNNLRFTSDRFVEIDQEVVNMKYFTYAQDHIDDPAEFQPLCYTKASKRYTEFELGIVPDDEQEWRLLSRSESVLFVMIIVHRNQDYQGLVLESVKSEGVRGRFRRVGKVEAIEYNNGHVFWEACGKAKISEHQYMSLDEEGRYVIEIV